MSKEELITRKEETYRKILDKCWDIAINEGLESLSIRKVAAALNFAPNNLYNYFTNKNDLLFQLKKDSYQWTFKYVFNDLEIGASMRKLLEEVAYKLLHVSLNEPKRFIVMTSDLIMDSEEPLDIEINNQVAKIIKKGIENHEFRMVDSQITSSIIRNTLISLVRYLSAQKNLTIEMADQYMAYYLSMLFNGLKA